MKLSDLVNSKYNFFLLYALSKIPPYFDFLSIYLCSYYKNVIEKRYSLYVLFFIGICIRIISARFPCWIRHSFHKTIKENIDILYVPFLHYIIFKRYYKHQKHFGIRKLYDCRKFLILSFYFW